MLPVPGDPMWHVNSSSGVATLVSELLYPCTLFYFLFLFVYARELLNGCMSNSHRRHVWSLAVTSLKVKVKGHQGQKQHFLTILAAMCGLFLV